MGNPVGSAPAMPAGRAHGVLCLDAPASSAEPWSRSHLFPLQTWRRRGEAWPALWVCQNPGNSPRLDPQRITPLPKSLALPMQGCGTAGGMSEGKLRHKHHCIPPFSRGGAHCASLGSRHGAGLTARS